MSAAAQFMVIMDTSIIGVAALTRMQEDLGFSQENQSWVVNAYVVAFGWLVLLIGSVIAGPRATLGASRPVAPS